jgi:hypothetical protein
LHGALCDEATRRGRAVADDGVRSAPYHEVLLVGSGGEHSPPFSFPKYTTI